jgi:hypothetical protein
MASEKLLYETVDLIRHVLSRPSFYFGTPSEVEALVVGLLAVAMSIETGEKPDMSLWHISEQIKDLTKDVPANREHHRYLCDERLIPDHKRSFPMLMKRGPQLCSRVLKSWNELHENNAGDIAEAQ